MESHSATTRPVGLIQSCLDNCIRYSTHRQIDAGLLADLPPVRRELTDMIVGLRTVRLLVREVGRLKDTRDPGAFMAGWEAKYYASKVAHECTSAAVELFGGRGYRAEEAVGRLWRDAKLARNIEGPNYLQHSTIAGQFIGRSDDGSEEIGGVGRRRNVVPADPGRNSRRCRDFSPGGGGRDQASRRPGRAGWRVEVIGDHCCGRPGLSEGMIEQTRKRAAALVAALAATSPSAPIVGTEPSCTSMLRDEYRRLLPDDQRRADVARRVVQLKQLLAEAIGAGHLRLRADSWLSDSRLVYQGHCHQKADVGTAATMASLRRVPGAEVTELDAGCCGMAGAFGYESEHYPVSMQVGRERLFPALESEPAETVAVASGFSCRQQIRHGAQRQTQYPLQVIASVVEE